MQIAHPNAAVGKHPLELRLDRIVMPGAERLPIGGIPEQRLITAVRHDVVDERGPTLDADRQAPDAPWPTPEEFPRHPFPSPIVATIVRVGPVTI
jgi:hypothetical protein